MTALTKTFAAARASLGTRQTRRAWLAVGAAATFSAAFAGQVRSSARPPSLVCVRLRGGADGLSLLVPYTNRAYYDARPHSAILPPSNAANSAIRLDDQYALHPGLRAIAPLYARRELLIWNSVCDTASDSHLEAERRIEQRLLSAGPLTRARGASLSERVFDAAGALGRAAPQMVLVDSEGWDTHVAQGRADYGRLADNSHELGLALMQLSELIQEYKASTQILVVSEFGRSVDENRMCGTDHGRASIAMAFGAGIPGGRVIGRDLDLSASARSSEGGVRASHDLGHVLALVRAAQSRRA